MVIIYLYPLSRNSWL